MLKRFKLLTSLVFLLVIHSSVAFAMTVAVFPIEDLSLGQNGANMEVTQFVSWELQNKGLDVIAEETVMEFMSRNRIRWLGFLDTKHILAARDEIGADLVLFGTLSLRQEASSPSLGLTLYLVRTDDSRTIWSSTSGLCKADLIQILGIAEPDEDDGLIPVLAKNVLESWPNELNFVVKRQEPFEIENVELGPSYLRRGEEIECTVKLRTRWPEENQPRVFFKTGGRVHLARRSSDGYTYNASWIVTDNDGRYPVTMVINWPSGRKKVSFLGAFKVDSAPPRIVLDLKGIKLEGTVAFRDQVIIIPKMLSREPIAKWKIVVEDEAGEAQMTQSGVGNMPLKFVWNGRSKSGWPANEGIYHVFLQVWDKAENMSVATQQVAVARTPPSMVLEAKNRGRDMIVDLNHEGKVPIAFWRMEMKSPTGEVIKVAEGDSLPFRMDLPISDEDKRKVECNITIKDVLGNKTEQKIDDIITFAKKQNEEVSEKQLEPAAPAWLEEF